MRASLLDFIGGTNEVVMKQLDYALIGNCQISALLDPRANIIWCCMPRFDSPSVFSSLLGTEENGSWGIVPESPDFETKQTYLPNTNVVKTEFSLKNGDRFEVIDFIPRFHHQDSYYRAPEIIRILRPIKGNPRIQMILNPVMDYGQSVPEANSTSTGLIFRHHLDKLYFNSDIPNTYILNRQPFELNADRYCVLSYGEPFGKPLKYCCEEYLERTVQYWRTWIKHCTIPFEYQGAVIRSALALKLHVFEDTGAIIASTTTSLPESPHGNRTWDYRFCWLRDAYFVINSLSQLGHFEEMEKFIQFLNNIAVSEPGAELQPVYGVGGETILEEKQLPWLRGWNGYGPVRIGNAAYQLPQYDAYGEMVLSVTPLFFDSRLDHIDQNRAFDNVTLLVERAIASIDKTDSGVWELRGVKKHHLFSKLMSWAAVDRGIKIARQLGREAKFSHWVAIRDKLRTDIETRGWNEELGFYAEAYEGTHPDASNLLMAALNFHRPTDHRYGLMVKNYEKLLMKNGLVFRYRNDDDFGAPSHAFTICTFWLVDALATIGRMAEAREIFENVLACANHVGLLSEDIDPEKRELWGNFPQTYSHVGLITSAFRLSKSWTDAF